MLRILLLLLLPTISFAQMKVGAAKVDITPPQGTPMAGYYSSRFSESVHDPLYAKAVVIESGGKTITLIGLDLISTTRAMTEKTRELVTKQTGIPGDCVMISATHAHTGPIVDAGTKRAELFGANEIARKYLAELPGRIADSVKKAYEASQPATMSAAVGEEKGLAFNRRFHMKDGTVAWNPAKKNPEILRPAGPSDDSVPLVVFHKADRAKTPIAAYVNFAMHLDTVGGLQVSADYPYFLSKCLAAAKGDDLLTLFTIGCAGDINHRNIDSIDPQKGQGEAARIGTRLAAAVLRAWDDLKPIEGDVRVSSRVVELATPTYTPAELAVAQQVVERLQKESKPKPTFLEQVGAFRTLDIAERTGKKYAVEVQVLAVGRDLAFVSLPGEIFVELGLSLKRSSPFPHTVIAELANGAIGYIPNRAAYPQGNYEVVSTRVAEGSGEKLVDSALEQLRELYRK